MFETIGIAHKLKLITNHLTTPQALKQDLKDKKKEKIFSLKETAKAIEHNLADFLFPNESSSDNSVIDLLIKKHILLNTLFCTTHDPRTSVIGTLLKKQVDELSFHDAVNEFTTLIAKCGLLDSLQFDTELEDWRLQRACMIALVYANVGEDTFKQFQKKLENFTMHDGLPVPRSDTMNYKLAFEEVLHLWDKSYDLFTGFNYFALATKRDGISEYSMFEKFIRQINKAKNYITYSPLDYGLAINSFPGPGIVIKGIHSNAFPDDYLNNSFSSSQNDKSPFEKIQSSYRNLIAESEKDLKETVFGFFRGAIIVRNPKILIDNKRYALVVLNDHFHNDSKEMALLVPDELASLFLLKPYERLKEFNEHYSEHTQYWDIINITQSSVLGGMDKALPPDSTFYEGSKFYPPLGRLKKLFYRESKPVERDLLEFERVHATKAAIDINQHAHRAFIFGNYWNENYDSRNLIPFKKAHDEITSSTNFAYTQLDLIKEAFRLYSYGYSFNKKSNEWTHKPYRLLAQSIRWHNSERAKEAEKPVLMPVPRLSFSQIDLDLVKEVGFIDTKNMIGYKDNTKGNFMLPVVIDKNALDKESRKNWRKFLYACYKNNANLIFTQGAHIRKQLTEHLS